MTLELDVAAKAALEAGKIVLRSYGRSRVRYKADKSIVTGADVQSERRIRSVLKRSFPDDAFLGEELGFSKGSTGRMWVIDPLDGSTNYSISNPFFSISLALIVSSEPVVGVVYYPCQNELFCAEKDSGAHLNGRKIRVSDTRSIKRSTLTFCHGSDLGSIRRISKIFGRLKKVTSRFRQMGAASLELCFTACGRVEAFIMVGVNAWDVAAGALMVQEAGGTVTDLHGRRFLGDSNTLMASNGKLHKRLLKLISA